MSDTLQYLRQCTLVVANAKGAGLDLSQLRISFTVKKTDAQTPNAAVIRIYNLAAETAAQIQHEFTTVVLQAGYNSNFGIIFAGTIKQAKLGIENGIDTYLDLAAGDGDAAYNFATLNTTLQAGSTQQGQINAALASLATHGITPGSITGVSPTQLPRGKVLYGMVRDYLRNSAHACQASWSIQNGALQMLPLTGVLPNQAIVLNSKSGLVGTPEQTNDGIKARCLLNPLVMIGGKVQINEADVARAALPDTTKDSPVNTPATVAKDGIYRVLKVDFNGDTRGNDWYSDLICLDVDAALPAASQVAL